LSRNQRLLAALALASSLLTACAGIDPARKAAVDRHLTELQTTGAAFPAAPFAPRPFQAGQHVTYLLKNQDGEPSFITQKVLEVNGSQVLLETVSESYRTSNATQLRLDIPDRRDPNSVRILGVRSRDGKGRVTEQPPAIVGMMRSLYEPLVAGLVVQVQTGPGERVQTSAGTFEGALHAHARVSLLGHVVDGESWSHPAVPISGGVRAISGGTTQELVEFGETGATASF
jgi:hypothetical protein